MGHGSARQGTFDLGVVESPKIGIYRRHGVAWAVPPDYRGEARLGQARQGRARQGLYPKLPRRGRAWLGWAWQGRAGLGRGCTTRLPRLGSAWQGEAGLGKAGAVPKITEARQGWAGLGVAGQGTAGAVPPNYRGKAR